MRIHKLATNIANQIAAGEVVERPASVVKELIENSIDANAQIIEIDIEKGGKHLISIHDDGTGIHKDDLSLAVTQHATSKIQALDDLANIESLGFRGEALASIAAVAKMTIASQYQSCEQAWQWQDDTVKPCAHSQGTTIQIRDLFYNVPVRRKFLKAERTEWQHIEDVVRRMALYHFNVAFSLRHNQRQVLKLKPALTQEQRLQRISKLLSLKFTQNAFHLECENQDLSLQAWVADANHARAHADQQYVFLNGRIIKDKLINHALRQAFDDIYQQGRYPAYVVFVQCAPQQVDVNVHPTKHEVRFVKPRLVHDFIVKNLQVLNDKKSTVHSKVIDTEYEPQKIYYITEANVTIKPEKPTLKAMAYIEQRFILAQRDNSIYLIDYLKTQQAMTRAALEQKKLRAQPLLFPETIQCQEKMVSQLMQAAPAYAEYGIAIEAAGPETVMVRSLPQCLRGASLTPFVKALADSDDIEQCIQKHAYIAGELSLNDMHAFLGKMQTYFSLKQLQQRHLAIMLTADNLKRLF